MTEKPEFRIPDLSNATPSFLVDELGSLREQIKDMQKYEGILKERLKAEYENDAKYKAEGSIKGTTFSVKATEVVQVRLDGDRIREEMGDEWCTAHSKEIKYIELRTKRN